MQHFHAIHGLDLKSVYETSYVILLKIKAKPEEDIPSAFARQAEIVKLKRKPAARIENPPRKAIQPQVRTRHGTATETRSAEATAWK